MSIDDKMREIEAALDYYDEQWKDGRDKLLALIRAAIAPQDDAKHEAMVEDWSRRMNNANNGGKPGWIDELRREAVILMRARPTPELEKALERLRERVANMDAADRGYRVRSAVLEMIDEEMNNGR